VVMANFAILRGDATAETAFPALRRFLTDISGRKDGVDGGEITPIDTLLSLKPKQ
jgi:hypothetical protein